jgi:mono/diheme cytochrome c family protein
LRTRPRSWATPRALQAFRWRLRITQATDNNRRSRKGKGMKPIAAGLFAVAFAGVLFAGASVRVLSQTPDPKPTSTPSIEIGANLVASNGCGGCHGAGLQGGFQGHSLYGIEHKLSAAQIADAIQHAKPPMPSYGLNGEQIGDIVAYLSSLDGGLGGTQPVVTFDPSMPTDQATITVRFPGTPPKSVSVLPIMQMGSGTMQTRQVQLKPSADDPHVFTGRVVFSMGGPWVVRVQYDEKTMSVPLNVGE